jgi:tRNA/tmRNA/rRNA uracil-C5-methylase (TrmA/RlmC/RlmD family)
MPRPPHKFNPVPFAYHEELELSIESLTNEGSGVARVDGWVVFVRSALPGERVKARVFRNNKNFSEADLISVLEASPHRVEPFCSLFGTCGGCQYQHLDYAEQLQWKQRQVAELLERMARIQHTVLPVIASPQQRAYRSKITPHFHKPKDGRVGEIGFLRAGTRNAMVDVPSCPIAIPALNDRLSTLRQQVQDGSHAYKNGATLLLRYADGKVLTHPHDLAREEVAAVKFDFQAGDFFQNNPYILPAFVQYAVDQAAGSGARFLIDAYCGSGLFGLCAAHRFESVSGVEVSETAVAKAQHNAQLNGITNASFIAASAEAIFAQVTTPAADTVVLIDPPRAGCSEDFLRQLFSYGPKAVVYVSCNPPTQMRDLALFTEAGYQLRSVQPFDLFPQTKHLECVMVLSKQGTTA